VRILLDTHVFIWCVDEVARLGDMQRVIEDPRNVPVVSAATAWEIAIKHVLRRLELPEPPQRFVPSRIRAIGATALPIDHAHALAVVSLPPIHGDPFDRLLVAQSQLLDIPLMTADPIFDRYGIEVLRIS
jgi:PIN domain nuclease of toxin-antitoxin system